MIRPPVRRLLALLAAAAAVSCAPPAPPAGAPVADPAAAAAALLRQTAPSAPQQATFRWELVESGTSLSGRGVARYEAPERLRLDLFGPRGETYLAAALVGDSFHVPPTVTDRIELPSPALLWAALGVMRAPPGASLQAVEALGAQLIVRYALPEGRTLEMRADTAGAVRLRRADLRGRSGVLESVEVQYAAAATAPSEARYRNWAAYRDLILKLEGVSDVASFPPAVWRPDAPAN